MTDHTDRPAPGTPVADLLAVLVQMPTEQVGHLLEFELTPAPVPELGRPYLLIEAATRQAAQAMADRLGLTGPPATKDTPIGTRTQWDGTVSARSVAVSHNDMSHTDTLTDCTEYLGLYAREFGQSLTVGVARLHQALALDEARDITAASVTIRGLRLHARTTGAARALAARLCPHAPCQHQYRTAPATGPHADDHWTYWSARDEDTTITGPACSVAPTHHHDATDTAADDTYY